MYCDTNWGDAEWNSFSPVPYGLNLTVQMSSTMPWWLWLSALMSMAVPASPAFAHPTPTASFDVQSYDLTLTPDMQNATVAGREAIRLRANDDGLKQLSFSGNALTIDSAKVDGLPVHTTVAGDSLIFDLTKPLKSGQIVKLELTYHGRPARGLARSATALYTSYFACDWMVCLQNAFGDKAAFSLALRVPARRDTISVGRMVSRRPGPDSSEIHSWKAPRPYSPYLYGFAVGRFARSSQQLKTTKLTYLSDVAGAEELERRFAIVPEMVRFISDKAGVPLPVAEYSQLLVEGDEAQEAATYSVIGINELPARTNDPGQDWVIVHELAHQWWGNLVTCATLQDFWLNEGITTFMTAAWKEHRYGRAAYDAELDVARGRWEKARAKGFDKPLAWGGRYPSLGTRRAVQYSKGALFMDHLRVTLGDAAFWSGLRRYTRAHAGRTVTSIDFERAMEDASGRDLRQVFADWVFGGDAEAEQPHSPGRSH
ncbi:peptidase M1-like protein [Novosphingobium sp. PhB55]|uniref:M1 family metallopeptidase n=1 Tax=Novosphingobium sp. PhB55 TaxID=2485106 RepID=UPI0010EF8318|nr:M1 family metallopeptidase [Novosphingobium sp. PhB55]TDW61601.1 peptidase M1-like protein [Novosphingobium sp. PhB55]